MTEEIQLSQKNYASHQGELAAIIYELRQFEDMLRFRPLVGGADKVRFKPHRGKLKEYSTQSDPR